MGKRSGVWAESSKSPCTSAGSCSVETNVGNEHLALLRM
jgi:hypothetical protein